MSDLTCPMCHRPVQLAKCLEQSNHGCDAQDVLSIYCPPCSLGIRRSNYPGMLTKEDETRIVFDWSNLVRQDGGGLGHD